MLAACSAADEPADGDATEAPEQDVPADDDDPDDVPQDEPEPEPEVDPAEVAAEVDADELGEIPVIMYHQLREDGGGDYDMTPEAFRDELVGLHEAGYVAITTDELTSGRIDVPAGTTPVVLTFDDSTRSQFALTEDGEVDPDTKVGIMLELADELDDFVATGSFYVLQSLFGVAEEQGAALLAELHDLGFELGNHSFSHANLSQLDAEGVQEELALGAQNIRDAVPDAEVTTISLPFGVNPEDRSLLGEGSFDGIDYSHAGALLVGSGPAPSVFHTDFEPLAIPRIRSQPDWSEGDEVDFGSGYWLDVLERDPQRRYVSDGDPDTVAFPEDRADEVADTVDEDRIVAY